MNGTKAKMMQPETVKPIETRQSWIKPELSELDINLTNGPGGSGADGFGGSS